MKWYALIWFLSFLDWAFTARGLRLGYLAEMNPLMPTDPTLFFLWKVGGVTVLLLLLWLLFRKSEGERAALLLLTSVYAVILAYHIYGLEALCTNV